jgi:dolichyl-diphosphooligosaccharide--protein glycosyltransferase
MSQKIPYQIIFYIFFLVVLFFGVYIRFDDTRIWEQNSAFFFYKGEPLYSEYDSFYFARYALDMKEGLFKSGEIDNFRLYPDNSSQAKLNDKESFAAKYSYSGHLISYIFYLLSEITGKSVAWLTYWLIPFMAVTVAIPLFFYFNTLGLPWAGLLGGLIALSAPMYLGRTGLMRLDHDVFNLTLPFLIAFFFYQFFQSRSLRGKTIWIALSSVTLIFYQLWYAHSNLNFVLILSFLFAYFWDYLKGLIFKREVKKPFSRQDILFLGILLIPQLWYIWAGPYYLYLQVKTLVFNLKNPTSADILFKDFPNIFMSISELQKMNFWEVLAAVIFNKFLGVLGLVGAFVLFVFHFRSLIFLFPFFVIGLLSFISGARFAMYLAPFIGLGLGYLVHFLFEKALPYLDIYKEEFKQRLVTTLVGILIFISALIAQREALGLLSTPKIFSPLVRDMEWIRINTPKNAIVFSWWDYGYAYQLYARRAVFHDGGSQGSPKTYLIARALSTSDPREGWLLTSFISNYGLSGLAKILKEGKTAKEVVEEIKEGKYAKSIKDPIYWVFTDDLISKFGWIYYFGSYDFDKREGIFGKIIAPTCKIIASNLIQCPELQDATIDLNNGIISVKNASVPLKNFYYYDGKTLTEKKFFEQGYTIEIVKTASNQTGLFLVEPPADNSLFNQMFLLRKYDPKYFELVYDNFPHAVIYRVKPE